MFNEIVDAYKNFWIQAGNFKGLTTRSDWWWVQLINFIISIIWRRWGFSGVRGF